MKYFSNLWRKYKGRLELMTTHEVSLRLIILYQLARKMNNVYDLYSLSKYAHQNINSSSISESRIKALYSILEQ